MSRKCLLNACFVSKILFIHHTHVLGFICLHYMNIMQMESVWLLHNPLLLEFIINLAWIPPNFSSTNFFHSPFLLKPQQLPPHALPGRQGTLSNSFEENVRGQVMVESVKIIRYH